MERILKIIFSIPGSIWFNLRYLPFKQAIRLPIWTAANVRIKRMHRGGIKINENCHIGMIRIGFHEADGIDTSAVHTILDVKHGGKFVIKSDAHIGQGAIIVINEGGQLTVGDRFAISGTTSIICSKAISFGNEVQLSWNSSIMDCDAHKIFDTDGNWINPPKEIKIGNRVWIAANTSVMKGSVIGNNVIVAANSLVNKPCLDDNMIYAGQPAKPIKPIGSFSI